MLRSREVATAVSVVTAASMILSACGIVEGNTTPEPTADVSRASVGLIDSESIKTLSNQSDIDHAESFLNKANSDCEIQYPEADKRITSVLLVNTDNDGLFGYGICDMGDGGVQVVDYFQYSGEIDENNAQIETTDINKPLEPMSVTTENGTFQGYGWTRDDGTKKVIMLTDADGNILMKNLDGASSVQLNNEETKNIEKMVEGLLSIGASPVEAAPELIATPTVTPYPELTVTPTEEVVPGSEVSRFFPPDSYWNLQGDNIEVGSVNIDVPITFGLTNKLTTREKHPIDNYEVGTEDKVGVNALRMFYFKVFYESYKNQKRLPDLTIEEYAQLVANGEGKIRVYAVDEATAVDKYDRDWYEVSITQGLNLVVGDEGEFSAHDQQSTYYIGINKEGDIVLGHDLERNSISQDPRNPIEQSPGYAIYTDTGIDQNVYLDLLQESGDIISQHPIRKIDK